MLAHLIGLVLLIPRPRDWASDEGGDVQHKGPKVILPKVDCRVVARRGPGNSGQHVHELLQGGDGAGKAPGLDLIGLKVP